MIRDQMRYILSYALGYIPEWDVKGGEEMDYVIDVVLDNENRGLNITCVLLMAQDLGFSELVAHILTRYWEITERRLCRRR